MRIGFIGSGVVVVAIARGGVAARMNASDFLFTDAHEIHAPALVAELDASVASSNGPLACQAGILVLGVKLHVQSAAIEMVTHIVRERPEMRVVFPVAGRTVESIAKDLGVAVPIIHVISNVNVQTGRSMSAIYSLGAPEEQVVAVEALMNKVGRSVRIEEKDLLAFQALTGYSPAWVFQIIEALARVGMKHGLTKEVSVAITAQALAGSADLALEAFEQGTVLSELIDGVCSPGGTTIAGLLAVEAQGMSTCLISAVEAVIVRDVEISARTR